MLSSNLHSYLFGWVHGRDHIVQSLIHGQQSIYGSNIINQCNRKKLTLTRIRSNMTNINTKKFFFFTYGCSWCYWQAKYTRSQFSKDSYLWRGASLLYFVNTWVTHSKHCKNVNTVEPLLRGHPDKRPTPLERPLENVNLNIICIDFYPRGEATPLKRPFFLCKMGGLTGWVPL